MTNVLSDLWPRKKFSLASARDFAPFPASLSHNNKCSNDRTNSKRSSSASISTSSISMPTYIPSVNSLYAWPKCQDTGSKARLSLFTASLAKVLRAACGCKRVTAGRSRLYDAFANCRNRSPTWEGSQRLASWLGVDNGLYPITSNALICCFSRTSARNLINRSIIEGIGSNIAQRRLLPLVFAAMPRKYFTSVASSSICASMQSTSSRASSRALMPTRNNNAVIAAPSVCTTAFKITSRTRVSFCSHSISCIFKNFESVFNFS
ncbi:hypothetical protein D3C77_470370 [compost metagenome]